jgi:hypothetical protein
MEKKTKLIELAILPELEESGVQKISLVENPAIEADFLYFKKEEFVEPNAGESRDKFISRCIAYNINEGKDADQATAICYSVWESKHEAFESYTDYPASAKAAAKRALEWRDAHPDQDCGTPVGWARANQLAKGEPVSEETIARMASFARHLQYKDVPYSEGCGGLMVDAWGGPAAIEWAQNKLAEIRGEFETVYPQPQEHKDDFLKRCTAVKVHEGMSPTDALESCRFIWNERFDTAKISYDYDDTLSTATGQTAALASMNAGYDVYVISARSSKEEMLPLTDSLGIPRDHVFATGSNAAKVAKVKELGITTHIDNNQEVVDLLGEVGQKFGIDTSSLPTYVDEVPKSRKDQVETPVPTWSWTFSDEFLVALEKLGSEIGIRAEEVEEINPGHFADQNAIKSADYTPARTHTKADKEEFVWKYSGGGPGPHRGFCQVMKSLNRYYSREELAMMDSLNKEFGPGGDSSYSIFLYKGGANCNHYFSKYSITRDGSRLKVTRVEIDGSNEEHMANTAPRTLQGRGYLKSPQSSLPGLSGHSAFSSVLRFEDEEKGILVGPAMIPNMAIPRIDDEGKPYDVVFSAETIEEIAKKYMKEARTNDVNQDHKEKDAGTYVFETWLIEDPKTDKANTVYGFNLPKGTWMVKMQIEDPQVRKRVKAGELRGFSVEGVFSDLAEIEAMKKYMKIKKILSN